ncbi:MAG: hypothetical protein IPK68_23380 [Bdellovibrionales bacterium]|nr:hypothetical protein [Bdellovibrionales bacterium]
MNSISLVKNSIYSIFLVSLIGCNGNWNNISMNNSSSNSDEIPPYAFKGNFCYDCLQVRVGRPLVVRHGSYDELDNAVPHLKLRNGKYRAFTGCTKTFSIEGKYPWQVTGDGYDPMIHTDQDRVLVLDKGKPGSSSECGKWLQSAIPLGKGIVMGIVHEEEQCNYSIHQAHKSLALTFSTNEGLTWSNPFSAMDSTVTILTGRSSPAYGKNTGIGDGQAILADDGYVYIYAIEFNTDSSSTIVARAPLTDLSPKAWKKYYRGGWNEPGIGGRGDSVSLLAPNPLEVSLKPASAFYLKDLKQTAIMGVQPENLLGQKAASGEKAVGYRLTPSFSFDQLHFYSFNEPILRFDYGWFSGPETLSYGYSMVNYFDGTNSVINTSFGINYTYAFPGAKTFGTDFYLVFQDISIQVLNQAPPLAQVGVELTRWLGVDTGMGSKNKKGRYRTTNGPVLGNYSSYSYDRNLGYVLTQATTDQSSHPTVKLKECKSNWTEEYMVTLDDGIATHDCDPLWYDHYRTIGWVFQKQEAGSLPIYRCWSPSRSSHFVSNQIDCEGKGSVMELLLGFVLSH